MDGFDEPVTAGQTLGLDFRDAVSCAFSIVGEGMMMRQEVYSWWKDGREAWCSLCISALSWVRIISPTFDQFSLAYLSRDPS